MYRWFFVSVFGIIAILPLYFRSVEHVRLQQRYGKERGTRIAEIYGLVSGWGFFLFWMGLWVSPQPRFHIPFLQNMSILVEPLKFAIPVSHLTLSTPFIMLGGWFGIKGVKDTTLKVAETHRTEKIVRTDVYSVVRHPQYLGGVLAHFGIALLLSALYALLATPLIVLVVHRISRKEEEELIREFGEEYEEYRKTVPMLLPQL